MRRVISDNTFKAPSLRKQGLRRQDYILSEGDACFFTNIIDDQVSLRFDYEHTDERNGVMAHHPRCHGKSEQA